MILSENVLIVHKPVQLAEL